MLDDFVEQVKAKKKELQAVLKRNGNILLLTHQSCLDGRVCEHIARKVFPNLLCVKLPASEHDNLLEHYDMSRFDAVLMADLSTNSPRILNRRKFVMIDHHESAADLKGANVFNCNDKCGSYLLKVFLEIIFDEDLSQYDKLVEMTNDYDLWIKAIPESSMLEHLFRVYSWDKFSERFENFDGTFTKEELDLYQLERNRLNDIWKNMEVYAEGHCMVIFEERFNNDVASKVFERAPGINIVIWVWYPYGGSVRLREGKEDIFSVGEYLKKIGIGGGHARAGGFRIDPMKSLSNTVWKMVKETKDIE